MQSKFVPIDYHSSRCPRCRIPQSILLARHTAVPVSEACAAGEMKASWHPAPAVSVSGACATGEGVAIKMTSAEV